MGHNLSCWLGCQSQFQWFCLTYLAKFNRKRSIVSIFIVPPCAMLHMLTWLHEKYIIIICRYIYAIINGAIVSKVYRPIIYNTNLFTLSQLSRGVWKIISPFQHFQQGSDIRVSMSFQILLRIGSCSTTCHEKPLIDRRWTWKKRVLYLIQHTVLPLSASQKIVYATVDGQCLEYLGYITLIHSCK